MSLPSFLKPLSVKPPNLPFYDSIFRHDSFGDAHALWWPAKNADLLPTTVIFFLPGNPGLLNFYTSFLTAIHDKDTTSRLAILGHSHLGHTPGVGPERLSTWYFTPGYELAIQIESVLEAFDAIRSVYGETVNVVIIGHSVGAWLALKVLKARPMNVSAAFLLFPTISYIGDTPNGKRLSWLFSPTSRAVLTFLSRLARFLPLRVLSSLFRDWPLPQILILRSFLHSPESVHATLTMANDEMKVIRELDLDLLNEHRHRLYFYYAEYDDWVGEQREHVLRSFTLDGAPFKVVDGQWDIPHAFCIRHGEALAEQCYHWLADAGLL